MSLIQTSAPSIEPVTLDEAKVHLRVIDTTDDLRITAMISDAREYAEVYCNRSFITQGWRLTIDAFPGGQAPGFAPFGQEYSQGGNVLQLQRGLVQSVDSIVYIDMAGSTQTITLPAAPAYALDLSGPLGRIAPGFGRIWPISLPQIGAVQINYTAGFGPAAANVPAGIRNWILMRVATLYENREEVALMTRGKIEPLPYVDRLLDRYTILLA